ncbi:hypothetical protein [Psychroserpens sp. Hel_I_66]|uniref:hypothetical protein n=1 Tax=Psychroserpens sp. Hel_I_66 TaxID=1250004 RepID=UPI000646604E|nr:hypothetical protein [Psychroserpens sp. Hel_I_66]
MIDTTDILNANIIQKYLFYIPSSVHSKVENSVLKGFIPKEGYDDIVYYKEKGNAISNDLESIIIPEILTKERILKKNLVLLLDTKSKISPAVFDMILEDYIKYINGHQYITTWMHENIRSVFPDVNDIIINAFKIQADYFTQHCLKVKHQFRIEKPEPTITDTDIFKTLKSQFSKSIETTNPIVFEKHKKSKKIKTIAERKRKKSFTDKEIDEFLLETVFSVKL